MRLASCALVLFLAIPTAAAAQTPSFDCDNAVTLRERTVCGDPKLADLDTRMATAYRALQASLSQTAADAVKTDQREWLQWLDKICPPQGDKFHDIAGCLEDRYNTRLNQLTSAPQRVGGLVIYPRTHFAFVLDHTKLNERPPGDPGYGYGEFAWPQIDHPTPAQQAWNEAVLAETISNSKIWQTRPKNLDEAVDRAGYVYGFYSLSSVDQRFIDVQLGRSSYGWGAAHPNTSVISFSWWLDKGRALQPGDIFGTNSEWRETMTPLTFAKLQQDPRLAADWESDKLDTANRLHDSIAVGISHPGNWTLSSTGLTITYGQYEVGPYSAGMPSVHFSWQELQPMLASGFDPAGLPPLLQEK
jgi:uncharacterized protein